MAVRRARDNRHDEIRRSSVDRASADGDAGRARVMGRVYCDGKQFAVDGRRFSFRGVTYGTFRPRADGARFPERDRMKQDLSAIEEAGFTVVRTYTPPPDDMVDLAADWGQHLLAGVFFPDWRYLIGTSRRELRRVAREARAEVQAAARRLAGNEAVLAISVGNEIPADVLRWVGTRVIAGVIGELAEVVREVDPDQLVTYANYPTAEYLPLDCLDFLTFNVFLERQADFRRYLTRLHHLAGDRPLVLGEVGLDAGTTEESENHQADFLDWQLETALERGVAGTCVFSWTDEWHVGENDVDGWHFGLTSADRSPRPSLDAATKWNQRTVADLLDTEKWLSISVVICAYNAATTIDECLRHTCALDYPDLEIIVVDDGSTDDTAAIARRYPRARLVSIDHGGLSVARNEGFRAATNEVVAYLDSDAYPTPEWPYYLALGLDGPNVLGVGGPNIPPRDDPLGAQQVARAPGGPVHVLFADDRAEHIPGCNMAFWKKALVETGGFDPVYTSAGDDVDLCWRVIDRGWEIGFHPAALVWHHRRAGLRAYLRQQRGYGRSEALVEARHPDRFTSAGTARWRGRIYNSVAPSATRQRVYRGIYGAAAYQSVYQGGGHALDLAHQVGVPFAALLLMMAPLALFWPPLIAAPSVALIALTVLAVLDVARSRPPRLLRGSALRFRMQVAALHLLQPLVRTWGRTRYRAIARRDLPPPTPLPGPVTTLARGVLLLPSDRPRADLAAAVVAELRRAGLRVIPASGWEDYDARLIGGAFMTADLVTSNHPEGAVQLRVRRRMRWGRLTILAFAATALGAVATGLVAVMLVAAAVDAVRGLWKTGGVVRNVVQRASA